MSLAEDLHSTAVAIAALDTEVAYRRAISTSYYAAFHGVIDAACSRIFLPGRPATLARRNFEHRQIRTAARNFSERGPTNEQRKFGLSAGPTDELRAFCTQLGDLGDARERADYNVDANHQRSQARQMLSLSRAVLDFCESPPTKDEFDALMLCMLMKSNKWSVR